MTSKFNNLAISTGYVESTSLGTLLVSHREGFDTHQEIFAAWCAALKVVYEKEHQLIRSIRGCCMLSQKAQPEATFCGTCRSPLKDDEVTVEDLLDYTFQIADGTLDSLGGEAWENFTKLGWSVPTEYPRGQMLSIHNFRPMIAGTEDPELQEWHNRLEFTAIGCEVLDAPVATEELRTVYHVVGGDLAKDIEEQTEAFHGPTSDEALSADEDDEEEDEYGKNPADFLFAISKNDAFDDNGGWTATFCPIKYFEETGYQYDQHLSIELPGWSCEMEGIYTPDTLTAPADMHAHLISLGYKTSEAFTRLFARDTDDLEFFEPGAGVQPCAPPAATFGYIGAVRCQTVRLPAMGKIDTEACKELITNLVIFNPGLVSKLFKGGFLASPEMDKDASDTKNWVRIHKQKTENGHTERTFNCKPFDDMLRAVVEDDGTDFVSVSIQGE